MSDAHWLDAGVIACAKCGFQMYWIESSPFYDGHKLHCDSCPRAVEINYYDPRYMKALEELKTERSWEKVMEIVEPLLKSCVCGGRFRGSAPKRCYSCS